MVGQPEIEQQVGRSCTPERDSSQLRRHPNFGRRIRVDWGLLEANEATVLRGAGPHARGALCGGKHVVYNKNSSQPGREADAVEPNEAYPASKVAAENALRESALSWAMVRFPFG